MRESDTIVAQATPPGRGGVGIVRVSGPGVSEIKKAILGKEIKPREASFCSFLSDNQETIDQGLAIYFSSPFSFTGEDVLELHGHGGQAIMDLLLQRVLELGARPANPGEFTQRAFLNNKLDLVQAEAIADLIDASSSQAAQNATRSLQGVFSEKINEAVGLLISLRTRIEATIDFVEEEDVEFATNNDFKKETKNLLLKVTNLKNKAEQGAIIQEGMTIVITGSTNAGKSSLFNLLSGEDRAIVTDIPGTTRDVLRVSTEINGLMVNFLDTAGLRNQPDVIEAEGIRRAKEEIKKTDYVLLVVDASLSNERNPKEEIKKLLRDLPKNVRAMVLYNKIDLTGEEARIEKNNNIDSVYLSVKTKEGISLFKEYLKSSVGINVVEQGFSARRRHLNALGEAEKYLKNISNLLDKGETELIAEELKEAQRALGEITGKVTSEDILNKIFSDFCIGK